MRCSAVRLIHHVVHDLRQAAQVDEGPGHPQSPPPRGFESHLEDVAQGVIRQGQHPRRGRFIYRDIGEMELVEIGVRLERRLPAVGAAVFAADPGLVHAPVALGVDVAHVEERLDHPVVAHHRAPENLFAQPHLPAACQLALASQVGGRDDLIPAVLRVAEDDRPGGLQRVVAIPQVALLRLDGPGGQLRHLARQSTQHRPIGGTDVGGACRLRWRAQGCLGLVAHCASDTCTPGCLSPNTGKPIVATNPPTP